MRLTRNECQRGVVFWNPSVRAVFRTSTSASPKEESPFSNPLTDPAGSKTDSPPGRYTRVELDLSGENPIFDRSIPLRLRWFREFDNVMNAQIWVDDLMEPPTKLMHIPNFGTYHRLVVSTPFLTWEDDVVLLGGDAIVRLVEGTVRGERVSPFDKIEKTEDGVAIAGGGTEEVFVDGRFVEVIAPGLTAEQAELRAFAILGLVALLIGRQAVGAVVFSERYHAVKGRQVGSVEIPVGVQLSRQTEFQELELAENALVPLFLDDRIARAVTLALRWYEKGLRADALIDRLLSFFIGIEVLINALTASRNVPETKERTSKFRSILAALSSSPQLQGWIKRVKQRVTEPTFTERLRYWATAQALDVKNVATFQRLTKVRNNVVHGRSVEVAYSDAVDAEHLLADFLRKSLALPGTTPRSPRVHTARASYELLIQQWHSQSP